MAITPRGSLLFDEASGTNASVAVPSDSEATDLEVAFCGSNFFTLDSPTDLQPSGTGWTLRHTVDRGVDDSKVRIWTRAAPAGAHTITLSTLGGEEIWLAVRRLVGADLVDPVDDVSGATAANGSHTAPALTLATEGYLLGCAMTAVFEGGSTYTPPAGFTELADFDLASSAAHATVAEDQAAGPGTVGPFTFTYSNPDPGLAAVIGIRPAGGVEPAQVTASIPLGLSATAAAAIDHEVSVGVPLAVQIAGTSAVDHAATAAVPLGLDLTSSAAADHDAGASVPLTLAAAATTEAPGVTAATAAIPLELAMAATTQADHQATATIPLTVGVGATAATERVVTTSVPLTVAVAAVAAADHAVAAAVPVTLVVSATTLTQDPNRPGIADIAPEVVATIAIVPPLAPSATAVPPRVPTSGGVT